MVKVGFTGTQRGMSGEQREVVWSKLLEFAGGGGLVGAHGDCVGADAEFHQLCRELVSGAWMVGHPPAVDAKRAWCVFDEVREPLPYLDRNKEIVRESEVLLACPFEMEEVLRSGTWSTVRYARRVEVPVVLVLPNGAVDE